MSNKTKAKLKQMTAHLPSHVIIDAESQISDRPFPKRFRIRKPKSLGKRANRLQPRGWRVSWPPRDSPLHRSTRFRVLIMIAILLFYLGRGRKPPAQHIIQKNHHSGCRCHCRSSHQISIKSADECSSIQYRYQI